MNHLIAAILSALLSLESAVAANPGTVVEFHIAPGTGAHAWNSANDPVEVKIGQILRLINDDNIPHLLHTGGKPCKHGNRKFGPGESYDCRITFPADPQTTILYDHQFGPDSRFHVRAIAP